MVEGMAISSPARLTRKRFFNISPLGTLSLVDGRLMFVTDGRATLDCSPTEITKIWSPRIMAGGGFKFTVGPDTWICTFDHIALSWDDEIAAQVSGFGGLTAASRSMKDFKLGRELAPKWMEALERERSR